MSNNVKLLTVQNKETNLTTRVDAELAKALLHREEKDWKIVPKKVFKKMLKKEQRMKKNAQAFVTHRKKGGHIEEYHDKDNTRIAMLVHSMSWVFASQEAEKEFQSNNMSIPELSGDKMDMWFENKPEFEKILIGQRLNIG